MKIKTGDSVRYQHKDRIENSMRDIYAAKDGQVGVVVEVWSNLGGVTVSFSDDTLFFYDDEFEKVKVYRD